MNTENSDSVQKNIALLSQQSKTFLPLLLQAIQKDNSAKTDQEKEKAKIQLVRTLRSVNLNAHPLSIEASGTSLIKMKQTLGHDEVQGIIMILLINLNDYFNVSKGLNTFQIIEISEMILSEYYHMRIEEIVYIFQNAKMHADLFGSFDGSKIFKWFKEYEESKEEGRHHRHLRQKNSDFTTYLPNDNVTRFKMLGDRLQKRYDSKNEAMRTGEAVKPEYKKLTKKATSTKRAKKS